MKQKLTSRELETQLSAKHDAIRARMDALQGELATTGDAVRDAVAKSPLVGVGSAIAAGLVVGLVFGGRGRKREKVLLNSEHAHRALIDRYVGALAEEVRYRVRSGKDVGEAVDVALRDRLPLIVYAPEAADARAGFFRQALDIAAKTAIGFGVKMLIDLITSQMDLVALQEQLLVEKEEAQGRPATKAAYEGPVPGAPEAQ